MEVRFRFWQSRSLKANWRKVKVIGNREGFQQLCANYIYYEMGIAL